MPPTLGWAAKNALSRSWDSARGRDRQHRAERGVQEAAGDAAQHRRAEAAPAVRADDDQVGLELACGVRDQIGNVTRAGDDLQLGGDAELVQLLDLSLDLRDQVELVAQHRGAAEAALQ